jgi:hypothetical protein
LYFIKEIENLSNVLYAVITALGYLSEHFASRRASQHFYRVLTNPRVLYNCTQHADAFFISSLHCSKTFKKLSADIQQALRIEIETH